MIDSELQDEDLRKALREYSRRFKDLTPVMKAISAVGLSQTQRNFADETAPNGSGWQPSKRKLERGGKTLTDKNNLAASVTAKYTATLAQWGIPSQIKYAIFHQLGTSKMPQRKIVADNMEEFPTDELTDILTRYLNGV